MTFLASNYYTYPIFIEQGIGSFLYDDFGKEYIDMFAGFGSVSVGHCHPRIQWALRDQAAQLCVNSRIFRNTNVELLARQLCELTGLDKFLPMNTGAEAVETAIKAARRWSNRNKGGAYIVAAHDNFHGRTTTIVGMSDDPKTTKDFGPFDYGSMCVPFNNLKELEDRMKGSYCAAVLLEPIQGEGGVIIPDDDYLVQVRRLCDQYNVLMMLDEVQSGMGRTGEWFAYNHTGVRPDVLIIGKALGGGVVPISGILATDKVMSVFDPGSHGSTFGGNPLAASVALETLRIYKNEGLVDQSRSKGLYLSQRFQAFNQIPIVKEIRCKGLWAGIQVHSQPSQYYFCEKLLEAGVATVTAKHNTIRFSPALNIKQDVLDRAFDETEKVLRAE